MVGILQCYADKEPILAVPRLILYFLTNFHQSEIEPKSFT